MDEVTSENAPAPLRDLYNRGFAAMERGNLDYAIAMFSRCIELAPGFHKARRLLRAVEVKRHRDKGISKISQGVAALTGLPLLLIGTAWLQLGKPLEAIKTAEKLLKKDPLNLEFIKLLGRAALAANAPEIAIQTLAIAREQYPDNIFVLNWLGNLYMDTAQTKQGRECFEALAALRPNDPAALKSLKDAMAIHSMSKEGWSDAATSANSYRNLIKNEKESTLLEQDSKAVKSEKDTQALIAENLVRIQREPRNINYRRALANLYAGNKMYAEALAALAEAQALSGSRDPLIDATIANVRIQQFDDDNVKQRAKGDEAGAAALERDRDKFVFDDVRDRIGRYANDLQLRYDYGVLLYEKGQINEAIQQFQLAQRHAQRRVQALYYIALCFKQKGQFDMALEQLDTAAAEHVPWDHTKKDIYYELGQILEATGNTAKALDCYKRIYQVDITYKDVSAKIDKGYKQ